MRVYGVLAYVPPDSGRARGTWAIKAEPHVMTRIGRLFLRSTLDSRGMLLVADTPDVARDIEWLLDRYPMRFHSPETGERLFAQADRHRAVAEQSSLILTGQHSLPMAAPARAPRDYQKVAADLAITTGRLLIGDDVGLGKSMTSLLVLGGPDALPALVVCLTHLPGQWLRELQATWPDLRGHIIRRGQPYDLRRAAGGRTPDVLIMSYSKLVGWAPALVGQIRTVIFDEAQELRHHGTQKYGAAAAVTDGVNYGIELTGTPVYNYGGEIHSILSVIAPDALGTRPEFLREWCGGASESSKPRVRNPRALGTFLRDQGLMLRRSRADVGRELPAPVIVEQPIDTDHKLLDKVTGDVAEIAAMILARGTAPQDRMRAASELDWRLRQATGIAKAPFVAEFARMLLETETRLVLYGWHRTVYDIWLQRLHDFQPVMYTGSESLAGKDRAVEAFIRGPSRVLVMSLRSGVGLDGLQGHCKVAVFGELDWSPQVHRQNVGRLRRDGQGDAEQVAAYFLVSEAGTDPAMAEVLDIKRMQADPIMDPDSAVFTPAADTGDRIRSLAADVLRKAGRPVSGAA